MPLLGPILAATDFSVHARHAIDRAACLAQETGASLTLMHVLPGGALQELREWLGAGHSLPRQLHDDARRRLDGLVSDLQMHRYLTAQAVTASGSAPDEIDRAADARQVALLVLGARGAGPLRRLVLGSTSERILRRTTRPVLVVRQAPLASYRRALLALDFSPWSAHVITLARHVAPHAQLLLFSAYQVPFEEKLHFAGVDTGMIEQYRQKSRAYATQRMHALAANSGLKPSEWELCIVEGEASQRIIELEQRSNCELVVLGKHGHSAAEDLLFGSVTSHVLAEGSSDVLVSTARGS